MLKVNVGDTPIVYDFADMVGVIKGTVPHSSTTFTVMVEESLVSTKVLGEGLLAVDV